MSNEKLKELAIQSGFHFYDLHDIDGQDLGETVEADNWSAIDKFAELIIQECISVIEPSDEHRKDSSWGYLGGQEGVELLDSNIEAIKDHFGVE